MDSSARSTNRWPGIAALALTAALVNGCTPKNEAADAAKNKKDTPNQVDPNSAGRELSLRQSLGLHTHNTTLEFRPQPKPIVQYAPSIWNLKVMDLKTEKGVSDFKLVHDKLMHLIIVSKDLSWFNHVHPEYKGYGSFVLQVTMPYAGNYKLYADYTPVGGDQEVAQKEFQVASAPASGIAPRAGTAKLIPDKLNGMWLTKTVNAHLEGETPNLEGTPYQVALMPMPKILRAGEDVMLHFQVRDAKGGPIKDLQPYLGALGHAVILSEDSNIYLHTHPMDGEHDMSNMASDGPAAPKPAAASDAAPAAAGPDVVFHTSFPAPGLYKIWGQFRHRDRIVTAPFVLNVEPGAKAAEPATDAHDHDHGNDADGHDHVH